MGIRIETGGSDIRVAASIKLFVEESAFSRG
jgi:hypothetical protein